MVMKASRHAGDSVIETIVNSKAEWPLQFPWTVVFLLE